MEVRIEPIIDPADVPACTQICCDAIAGDTFVKFLERYGPESFYNETARRISDAVDPQNQTDFAFKAIVTSEDQGVQHETIVGVSHWYLGYVVVPKVDPFAKNRIVEDSNHISPYDVAVGDKHGKGELAESQNRRRAAAIADLYRQTGNFYVGTIRGKRHIYLRRMMVLPSYQKKGIGKKLLQWGLDIADRDNIVAWLNASTVAAKLYSDAEFKAVGTVQPQIPEGEESFDVAPIVAMLRTPVKRTRA